MTDLSEHGNREGEGENLAMVCLPGSFIKKPDNVMTGPDAVSYTHLTLPTIYSV